MDSVTPAEIVAAAVDAAEKKARFAPRDYLIRGALSGIFLSSVLCNWMVTIGAILAFSSRSTIGRIIAMWLPITTFFAQGFEHPVVNMFVIPIATAEPVAEMAAAR